ncbi:TonB-dependent receptor [Pedobacter panaciterrae]|uniref:TonB-dependent receptor n=1 Tax=Pedobacter panaciterrae TaxID=363849 RepID=UPI00259A3BD5|nr:TonB-dependent receptor [uncultured Pedobacter sp.]
MNRIIACLCLSIFICFAASAQQNKISGTVKDAKGVPVDAVTVQVLNTNLSTVTDLTGAFELVNVPSGKVSLRFSAVGYAAINKLVTDDNRSMNITLEDAGLKLDEVIVSAQKTEENVQNIPSSISVFSSAKVNDYRIQNTRDLSAIVPNLYSSNPGDGRNVTSIRGITTTSYDPAVATYIDGVNQFGLDTYISSLFDLERIEVLRGPQGTLYGRNAMGGVINIITKKPANYTTGFAGVDFGNYGQQRYSAGIRTALIKDKLFFGAAGLVNRQSGFYTNEFNNKKYDRLHGYLGNYYLKFQGSSKFDLTLNVKHNENRNDGTFPLVASVEDALSSPFKVNQNTLTKMFDNLFNASLSANYAGDGFNFTSQSAYQSNYRYYDKPIDSDFSPIDGISLINNYGKDWNKIQVLTQEFKFSSPSSSTSKLKWVGGVYGFYQKNPVKQGLSFGEDAEMVGSMPGLNIISINKGKGFGLAAFGQVSYAITDELSATAGLRYDYEHKKQGVYGEMLMPGETQPIVEQKDTSATATFNALSPKVSLAYLFVADHSLYATYSRGFRAGGLTQIGSDRTARPLVAYKPEYGNNLEFGSKNTFFDQRLSVNVAAFYVRLTDAQIPVLILPDAITITRNAGKLSSKGVEVELSARPVKGLSVDYNFGYTDAKYKSLSLPVDKEVVNFDGNKQIYTPEMTSMLALQYGYQIENLNKLNLIARGEWAYTGDQFFDLQNRFEQKGYHLFNAKIGVSNKRFDVFFWGRNLSDKTYVDYVYDFGAAHLGNPKTYGISLAGRF